MQTREWFEDDPQWTEVPTDSELELEAVRKIYIEFQFNVAESLERMRTAFGEFGKVAAKALDPSMTTDGETIREAALRKKQAPHSMAGEQHFKHRGRSKR